MVVAVVVQWDEVVHEVALDPLVVVQWDVVDREDEVDQIEEVEGKLINKAQIDFRASYEFTSSSCPNPARIRGQVDFRAQFILGRIRFKV